MTLMGNHCYIILWSGLMSNVNVNALSQEGGCTLEVTIVENLKVYECPYMAKLYFFVARNSLMSSPWIIILFLIS